MVCTQELIFQALLCAPPVRSLTFTPTVNHCSMATLIGLCLRVKLLRVMPARFKVDIAVSPLGLTVSIQGGEQVQLCALCPMSKQLLVDGGNACIGGFGIMSCASLLVVSLQESNLTEQGASD